ncbi:BatD family protein [Planctomycetes bacterium TBK1r]|uniref:Tetratricopeptide repeat protein n=1 Tax=Stieleria magnilauensis TaxID=2527963 RepID=A0ABX5Y1A2_9BACT|nr:Tetratricopeptide repeat protein [Planctomycetes bacterium TBK1r]
MKNFITTITLAALLTASVSAANIDARLSTREAYVGSPVTLQVTVSDATDYEQPALPAIDGCDVRSAGSPSQSSQITIINGRRRDSRSVTMQYLITPRREGTFTVPSMSLNVDGKTVTTNAMRFVATKSDTGDLMFVEIAGGKENVFVGQPIDLKLKIWIKPFRDVKTGQTLSEGEMWNMISDSTSWGGFTARMKEMAANNQRPGGQEVLRDDGNSGQRVYYLYEINATVYPKRAGKIDASDVQIVVDYPTALGRSRSPFGSMFGDDMFGGNSMKSRMMNDDFFGSSFGNRMAVVASRPIVGEVSVDATEVRPVPSEGRPANYRGAVGRYRIVTQATPTTVDAGDPITLNIGIAGTGPMELVQAPPLYEQSDLTKNFKVADESLAGFVKDDTKVFSTSIRPRHEGITEIPPIRFSFFDPETETFQTVTSDPIAVTVNKSETLALDAIVGNARNATPGSAGPLANANLPDFTNQGGKNVLMSHTPRGESNWWWGFVILPPMVWIGVVIAKYRDLIVGRILSFRSPKARCLAAIKRAKSGEEIAQAIALFMLRRGRTRTSWHSRSDDAQTLSINAVGVLRVAGIYDVANEAESFLAKCTTGDAQSLEDWAIKATAMVETIDTALANKKTRIKTRKRSVAKVALHRSLGLVIATAVVMSVGGASASEPLTLSQPQQESLLEEASQAYNQGVSAAQTDSAEAKELLATATSKYQLLVDSGIKNADLFTNLGNAYLQAGKLGHAIANYEKAICLDSGNAHATNNLAFANEKVVGVQALTNSATSVRALNNRVTALVGASVITWTLGLSSIFFWGLLIVRVVHQSFPVWKWAAVPFALLLISLGSFALTQSNPQMPWNAVVLVDHMSLHAGDGEQFDEVVSVDAAQGHRVEVLTHRGVWAQICTTDGHRGWVHDREIEVVKAV